MRLRRLKQIILTGLGLFSLLSGVAEAANVSRKELEQVEQQVKAQNLEHQRLQEQASKISRELKDVNQQMIKSAKMIQNSEESLSKMEAELEQLTNDLQQAQTNFSSQDENLIKTLSALQNLALKPTESLFVQPLNPVEIIRSAMLLRETVPYLEENASRLRKELEKIEMVRQLDNIYRLDHAVTANQKVILKAFGLDANSIKYFASELSKELKEAE